MTIPFAAHNVILPDGSQTAPGQLPVTSFGVFRAAMRYLDAEFGPGPHPDISVADLGCLEGGYAAEFARAGFDTTGVEARQDNYDSAIWLQAQLGLPNLHYIQGDVNDVLPGMEFDVVFCAGLLYHLEFPVAFLKLLGQVTRRILILNTHFSMENGHPESAHAPMPAWCDAPGDPHEGHAGHWFHEGTGRFESFGNRRSFWLRKDDLIGVLYEAGFDSVAETHDWRDSHALAWGGGGPTADRGMFTAFKD